MRGRAKDEAFDTFVTAAFRALNDFAEHEYQTLARKVRYTLRRCPPSHVYGEDFCPRQLWDEYCFEVQEGPTDQLEWSWEHTIQPLIANRIDQLPSEVGVLLTIASQWAVDDFEHQDGAVKSDELLARGVWIALRELASQQIARKG